MSPADCLRAPKHATFRALICAYRDPERFVIQSAVSEDKVESIRKVKLLGSFTPPPRLLSLSLVLLRLEVPQLSLLVCPPTMDKNSSHVALSCVYDAPMAHADDHPHTHGLEPSEAYLRNQRLIRDAETCTVGPMPVQGFIDAFLPLIPEDKRQEVLSSEGTFNDVPSSGAKPVDIYIPLVRVSIIHLRKRVLCPTSLLH